MTNQFARLQLHPELVQTVSTLGYTEPTPIQSAVIPVLLAGQDVIGQAKTGTGKTAAFALPMLHNLTLGADHVQALVVTPTRELAVQVAGAIRDYGRHLGVRVLAVYGGAPYPPQIRQLREGVEVVVGTPGRLMDLMKRKSLDLSEVAMVVLDEADEMLSMGFIEDIETILGATPAMRQTALFSATMSPQVRRLANGYLHKPQSITVQNQELTATNVEQRYSMVNPHDKTNALTRLLEIEPTARAIVFVRTRADSTRVADELTERGFPAEALNGDMDQDARTRTLNRFRRGQLQVLVGTDVAARGLDIDDISHVFNYDLPTDPEVYVHRIGRTGRAGRNGIAISLVSGAERGHLRRIESLIKQHLTEAELPSIEAIEQHRAAQLQEQLVLWIERGRGNRERGLVETMMTEGGYDPADIATAALKLLSREQKQLPVEHISPVRTGHMMSKPSKKRSPGNGSGYSNSNGNGSNGNNNGSGKGKRPSRDVKRDDSRQSHEQGMVRLSLNTGHVHGIRPNEVVSTLAYHGGVPGSAIGKINIHQNHTLVDVPEQFVSQILDKSDAYRIRRQAVRAEVA